MDSTKRYNATCRRDSTTATDDPESSEAQFSPALGPGHVPPSRQHIELAIQTFVGAIQQRPPAFSAMKVGGRRAYDLARRGHDVELEPRLVRVYAIERLGYEWPQLSLRIDCGRGTYIRSIARDLGQALGVGGGYLTA